MSDKPSPKASAGKSAGSGTKGIPSKSRHGFIDDEPLDFLGRPQSSDELGRLAHYRILKVLGKGGMGIVFMAEDTRLHRIVALKVMLPSIAKKAVARDRFLREARATAAIEHDHIVTIYHVSEPDEPVPYLAMQFLKGMTLEDWLKSGKTLNVPQIMRIGKEIAKALAAAHAQKLIHRDIKPSNIWLDAANKGRVKILDFGLARPTNEETHLTQEGMILGSPAYMSPEQARGEDVDERCDLFSLGCVMYRLCAGRLPFGGKDAMSMLLEITSKEPASLILANPELPPTLADLVHRLLAKKPAERFASAREVVQRMQEIEREWVARGRTVSTAPVKPKEVDVEQVLEESAITELELQDTNVPGRTQAPRSRSWVLAGLTGALIGVLSICCCVGLVAFTDQGNVELHAEDETARQLLADGIVLVDHKQQKHMLELGHPLRLHSGEYRVDTSALPKGLILDHRIWVYRGETETIKARYETPRTPQPPVVLLESWEDARKQQGAWASFLKRELVETNSLQSKMALVPPGEFMMGSSKEWIDKHLREKKLLPSEAYNKQLQAEMPQHRVRISQPFYVGATEVTLGQFMAFVTAEKYQTLPQTSKRGGTSVEDGKETARDPKYTWAAPGYKTTKEHPVNNIAWKDAEAFCAWLSKKEGRTYRLPTEAEWEYACRAGTKTAWSFADDLKSPAELRSHMVFHIPLPPFGKGKNNPQTPMPVARLKKNEFGLFDMHGNVAEMCSDSWDPAYYARLAKEQVTVDPKGPPNRAQRVVRGGSFLSTPQQCRSAYRSGVDPSLGYVNVGFRIVCEIATPAE
ncbi:MAG TPA: bifunctional serine/threonine-protein kinase/formylglycine-generating enzyme family protein [Gemmataceae bacterium]|nr:bifunctional serine/threonine-protein kinase/formylglycine-generating enzyme family protein [Gemmataceae bacterium]